MSTATKSDFAREHDVTPPTVTRWVKRGLAILNNAGRVERELSNRKLAGRPIVYRGGRIGGTPKGGPWPEGRTEEQDIKLIRETLRRLKAAGETLVPVDEFVAVANEVLEEWS